MIDHLKHMAQTRPAGHDREAAAWAVNEIERLRAIVNDACEVLRHYDLPEHAFHYERVLADKVPLTRGDEQEARTE